MFPSFDQLRPVFEFMFRSGPVKIFLSGLPINSECHIQSLPPAPCDAASIRLASIQMLSDCYQLEDIQIKRVTLKTPSYTLYLDYTRECAVLKTDSTSLIRVVKAVIQQVPNLSLQVVMPAQN
jgi:hypothetical protein